MRLVYVGLTVLAVAVTVVMAGRRPGSATPPAPIAPAVVRPVPAAQTAPAAQAAPAQRPQMRKYLKEATVEHKPGAAVVTANDPRPLWQAVEALNEEYGWVVDYEDPPYADDSEVTDNIIDPQWWAAHPDAPRGTIPAGGPFRSDFVETAALKTPAGQMGALRRVVAQYNASGNPGKFFVRQQGGGRYTVIGNSVKNQAGRNRSVTPVLDTPVSIPAQERGAWETLQLIFDQVSAKTGAKVSLGWVPNNLLIPARVTVGGENVPARDLVAQTLDATGRPVVYSLFYFRNGNSYIFNATVAVQAVRDTYGRKTLTPLDALSPRRQP